MKITAFNPLIISPKAADAVALFEELGFERAHTKTGIEDDITSFDLKLGEDFRVDITQVDQMPQDMTTIRISVDDFDEAYELLLSKGFKNAQGDRITETPTSKATMMVAPSGFAFSLSQHIRK